MRALLLLGLAILVLAPALQANPFDPFRTLEQVARVSLVTHAGGVPATATLNGATVPWSEAAWVLRNLPAPLPTGGVVGPDGDFALASRMAGNEPCWWSAAATAFAEGPGAPAATFTGITVTGAPVAWPVACSAGIARWLGEVHGSPAPGVRTAAVCLAHGPGTQPFYYAHSLCIAGVGAFKEASLTGDVGVIDVVACQANWCAHATALAGGPVEDLPKPAQVLPQYYNDEANVALVQIT